MYHNNKKLFSFAILQYIIKLKSLQIRLLAKSAHISRMKLILKIFLKFLNHNTRKLTKLNFKFFKKRSKERALI